MLKQGRIARRAVLGREDGIAMLTVLMLTIILTVIGVAAITSTSLDIKMAGGERVRESSVNAAEACMSSGVQIIQQTLQNGAVPATKSGAEAKTREPGARRITRENNQVKTEIQGQAARQPGRAD